MTKEQLASEKTVLQKNLLYYEGLHGRPVSLNSFSPILSYTKTEASVCGTTYTLAHFDINTFVLFSYLIRKFIFLKLSPEMCFLAIEHSLKKKFFLI